MNEVAKAVAAIGAHQITLRESREGIDSEIRNLSDYVASVMKRLWDKHVDSDEVYYQKMDRLMFVSGCHVEGWKPDPISLVLYAGEVGEYGEVGEHLIYVADGKWHLVKHEEVTNTDSELGYDYKRVESVTDIVSVDPESIRNFLDAVSKETGLAFKQYQHSH